MPGPRAPHGGPAGATLRVAPLAPTGGAPGQPFPLSLSSLQRGRRRGHSPGGVRVSGAACSGRHAACFGARAPATPAHTPAVAGGRRLQTPPGPSPPAASARLERYRERNTSREPGDKARRGYGGSRRVTAGHGGSRRVTAGHGGRVGASCQPGAQLPTAGVRAPGPAFRISGSPLSPGSLISTDAARRPRPAAALLLRGRWAA